MPKGIAFGLSDSWLVAQLSFLFSMRHSERNRCSGGGKDSAWGIGAAREIPRPAGENAGFGKTHGI